MPLLYYADSCVGHRLFDAKLEVIKSKVFDNFKIDDLAPLSQLTYVANFWHFTKRKHCAFSWHDGDMYEHTAFIPALLGWRDALAVAREEFAPTVIPSSIVFRLNNYKRAYLYD